MAILCIMLGKYVSFFCRQLSNAIPPYLYYARVFQIRPLAKILEKRKVL